jgi:hypothetical protein
MSERDTIALAEYHENIANEKESEARSHRKYAAFLREQADEIREFEKTVMPR